MAITAEECLSRMNHSLEVISIFKQTKMFDGPVLLDPFLSLMAQCCWLFPEVDCLRWLQPDFFTAVPVVKITPYAVYFAGSCGLLACIFYCCVGVGVWLSETQLFGGFGDWGTYAYLKGCFCISGFAYCLWGQYFIRVNHRLY